MSPTSPTSPTTSAPDDHHTSKRRRLDASQDDGYDEADQTTPRQTRPSESYTLAANERLTPEATLSRSRQQSSLSQSNRKSVDLSSLQVPVTLHNIPTPQHAKESLPADILPLYTSIRSVAFRHKAFIPAEVRDKIKDIFKDETEDFWFRPSSDGSAAAKLQADWEFKSLQSVRAAANKSKELSRHEDAWNAEVNLPVLKLALHSDVDEVRPDHDDDTNLAQGPQVTPELITSATMTVESIPRLGVLERRGLGAVSQGDEGSSILACSVEGSGGPPSTSSNNNNNNGTSRPASAAAAVHSKQGSKKVDLAILFVPAPSSPLSEAIQYARQWGSVNQSMYGPLRQNPIACAIETKTSTASVDPMLQLGIWTVAWYRRMDTLWHTIHQGDGRGRGQVVSLPLISIVDQQWSVYFAVDRGDHIVSFSPSTC